MKGKLIDIIVANNKKQHIVIEIDEDFRDEYQKLFGENVEVNIKKWYTKRSKDQNSYFHALVNEIAIRQCLGNEEVKKRLVVEYGVLARAPDGSIIGFKVPENVQVDYIYPYTYMYKKIKENGKTYFCYLVYKRSRDLDSKEMSRLIDGTVYEAKELGIDPEKYK